jgi:Cys-rich protein (TIGR01571 family)
MSYNTLKDDGTTPPANQGESGGNTTTSIPSEWMQRSPGQADETLLCGEKGWSFGLFDGCCNGGAIGFCTRLFCGSCMYGRALAMALDQNCFLCCLCGSYCFCCCRGKLREKYNIEGGSAVLDCIKCMFCSVCTIQQMIQEVNSRTGKQIGAFGDPDGSWNVKLDCGNDANINVTTTGIDDGMER